jgi:hypothetical protein
MDPMSTWYVVALVAAAPFVTVGTLSAAIGVLTLYATWRGGRDPRDAAQERACAGRRAGLLRRAAWLVYEGICQGIAFTCQGLHILRRWTPPPPPRAEGATPVVLLAGYLENSGTMYVLGARLRRRGFLVIHRDLPSTLHRIESNAAWLRAEVDRILEATGADRVALVGHSMGGVISRTLVHRDPCAPVATVVSIASPHRGTHMGRFGIGASARDMLPGSEHCRRYPTPREVECQAPKVHCVVGHAENIVSPYWSSILDGEGEAVVLDAPTGHVGPLFMPSVCDLVVRWLEEAGVRRVGEAVPAAPVEAPAPRVDAAA